MTPGRVEALNKALFAVQIVSIILRRLGEGETAIDPAAVEWIGQQLEAAYEAASQAAEVLVPGGECGA